MTTPVPDDLVERLAEAYRRRGEPYADAVIAGRHLDLSPRQVATARAMARTELAAELAVLGAEHAVLVAQRDRVTAEPDPVAARLRALLALDDDELADLHRAGLLDNLDLGTQ